MKLFSAVIILVALSVCGSSAQVYIDTTGTEWNGVCNDSCPESAPCQLSSSGTTTIASPCIVSFKGGMAIPGHYFTGSFAGNITMTSSGPVSLGVFNVVNRAGDVILDNFIGIGEPIMELTSLRTTIIDSYVAISAPTWQIIFVESSSVTIENSYFFSTKAPFHLQSLAADAWVHLSGVTINSTEGVTTASSTQASIAIRNSRITPLRFPLSDFTDFTLDNVVGTLNSRDVMFDRLPTGVIAIVDSNISSPSTARLSPWYASKTQTLTIQRSHFENVLVHAAARYLQLQNSTFTVDGLEEMVVNFGDIFSLRVDNVAINTRTAIGSAPVLSSFTAGLRPLGYMDHVAITGLSYDSPSTVPRMRISARYLPLSTSVEFPSLEIVDFSAMHIVGSGPIKFTGDISTNGPTAIKFENAFDVHFSSIALASGLSFECSGNKLFYQVTKPHHGIQCRGDPNCITPNSTEIRVVWDSTLPLPIAGQQYPGINGGNPFTSNSTEFTISSTNSNSISFFSFQTVQCPAHCNTANSGDCTSNTQCSCRPGYGGIDCENVVPITPIDSPTSPISPSSPSSSTSPGSPTNSAQQQVSNYIPYLAFILLFWI